MAGYPSTRGGNGKFTSWWRSSMHRKCSRGIVLTYPSQYNFQILQFIHPYVETSSCLPKKLKTLIALCHQTDVQYLRSCIEPRRVWCDASWDKRTRSWKYKLNLHSLQSHINPRMTSLKKESVRTPQPLAHISPHILEDICCHYSIPGGGANEVFWWMLNCAWANSPIILSSGFQVLPSGFFP